MTFVGGVVKISCVGGMRDSCGTCVGECETLMCNMCVGGYETHVWGDARHACMTCVWGRVRHVYGGV